MFTVELDTKELDAWLSKLEGVGEVVKKGEILTRLAINQIARIKLRTAEGVDYEGERFTPYSDSYAAYRAFHGRPTKEVDLFFTGHMLASITHEKIGYDAVRIFFASGAEGAKAFAHQYGEGVPKREFFSISQDDVDAMVVELEEELKVLTGEKQSG